MCRVIYVKGAIYPKTSVELNFKNIVYWILLHPKDKATHSCH